jgi:two-component system, NarL family, sensor histidine kinase DesK
MALADTRERGWRFGWVFAAVWLFWLNENVKALLHQPNLWWRDVGLVAVGGFAVVYVVMTGLLRRSRHALPAMSVVRSRWLTVRVWCALVAMMVLFGLQVPGAGAKALTCLVYVAATGVVGLPLYPGIAVAAVLGVTAEVLPLLVGGWVDDGYGLAVLLGSAATWGMRLAGERQNRLRVAQSEIAVQNERARIAADLHDILGHSLTVVTVKAELAQRLLDLDLERARKELQDLESLARDALSDVRATAMGVRGISLPGEIAAARAALAAANVEARLPGAADEVPTRNRELFAWTIREAVTNIVRHAHARHAEVRLGPASVEIVDDGVASPASTGDGQGLRGLRRRAEKHGARLIAGQRDDTPGFRVRVEVP